MENNKRIVLARTVRTYQRHFSNFMGEIQQTQFISYSSCARHSVPVLVSLWHPVFYSSVERLLVVAVAPH